MTGTEGYTEPAGPSCEALGRLVHETRPWPHAWQAHGQKFILGPWDERHPEQQELRHADRRCRRGSRTGAR